MEPIRSFDQLTSHLKSLNKRKRIAVVCANDPNTEYAIARSLEEGIAEFLMVGDSAILEKYPTLKKYPQYVRTVHIEDPDEAAREAVRIVREGGADILMKGIINTDNLLHAILDKEKGLLPKGKILTHLAVMQIPTYGEGKCQVPPFVRLCQYRGVGGGRRIRKCNNRWSVGCKDFL